MSTMKATVDVDLLHKAISQSFKDVFAAHSYLVCERVKGLGIEPIHAVDMLSLISEIGRNAAQACLSEAIQEVASLPLLEEAIALAKEDHHGYLLEILVQLRSQLFLSAPAKRAQ